MKTINMWAFCPITYDENKYSYHKENEYVSVLEKETSNSIFKILSPTLIQQIKENEFIIHYPKSLKSDSFYLKHIRYQKESNSIEIIYQTKYTPKRRTGRIKTLENLFFMESWRETILYNANTKKCLSLENLQIETEQEQNGEYTLIGTIEIEEQDNLTMIIDKDTLDFNGFYSSLQERYIPIKQESNTFIENYNLTLEKEVLKYIELLEIQKEIYREKSNQKAREVLKKKRINKEQ